MAKVLLSGAARPVANFNERVQALFRDRVDHSTKPPPQRKKLRSGVGRDGVERDKDAPKRQSGENGDD